MPDIGDFIRWSRRSAKIAIAAPGTPGDFRRSRRSAYKIAKCVAGLSRQHNWRFYTPIAANLIASDFRHRLMRTHLAIFFTDRGDVALQHCSCDKITQPNWLTLLAIRSDECRKSRERAHLANAGEFIADIWHARYRRFYTPIAAIGENRNRCTGHTWRFSLIAAIGV